MGYESYLMTSDDRLAKRVGEEYCKQVFDGLKIIALWESSKAIDDMFAKESLQPFFQNSVCEDSVYDYRMPVEGSFAIDAAGLIRVRTRVLQELGVFLLLGMVGVDENGSFSNDIVDVVKKPNASIDSPDSPFLSVIADLHDNAFFVDDLIYIYERLGEILTALRFSENHRFFCISFC